LHTFDRKLEKKNGQRGEGRFKGRETARGIGSGRSKVHSKGEKKKRRKILQAAYEQATAINEGTALWGKEKSGWKREKKRGQGRSKSRINPGDEIERHAKGAMTKTDSL